MGRWVTQSAPAHIPTFGATRVVLLTPTPTPHALSWDANRAVATMQAALRALHILEPHEVEVWIARLASAVPPEIRKLPPNREALVRRFVQQVMLDGNLDVVDELVDGTRNRGLEERIAAYCRKMEMARNLSPGTAEASTRLHPWVTR